MPNWCTNRLSVSGHAAQISAFKARYIVTDADGKTAFDFERIVPMPPALLNTEHLYEAQIGLAALDRIDIPGIDRVRATQLWRAERDGIAVEDFPEYLLHKYPDCLDKARGATRLFEATGHISWYDWAVDNWGTKWNARAFHESFDQPDEFEFIFDTAWSAPMPIYQALFNLLPDLTFEFAGIEAMMDFAYHGAIAKGAFHCEFTDAGDDAYHAVFGVYPDRDEFEEQDE
jgi:hypothetical protein